VLDGSVFGGFLLGFAVLMFYQGLDVEAARASVVFGVLASTGAVVVVVRTMHAGIKTDPGGITVVPVFGRSRRLPWPDVRGFRLDEVPNVRHRAGWLAVYVIPRDGNHLHTSGCIFERTAKRSQLARAQEVLRALEAERQHWTATA
jgi:Bacterial PH domain